MKPEATLLITGREVRSLLSLEECITSVEQAFRLHGEGKVTSPGALGIHTRGGGFHIKAGVLDLGRAYFAAKVNGNFSENGPRFGLPTIQGLVVLADAGNGSLLAVVDSMEITALRTGAASAVAAKYLARKDSRVATIVGCGNQGRVQMHALASMLRLQKVYAHDVAENRARQMAEQLSTELKLEVRAVSDLSSAVRESDVLVTCTSSRKYFLRRADVQPGTFIAAVGADNPEKQELEPALMAGSKIVVDILEQCASFGDLRHALQARVMTAADVHAELGEVVAGKKPGRTSEKETIIFDSTGMALQDVAAAAVVYEKAVQTGHSRSLNFAA
jgi:alanine dehydrogenase